MPDITTFDREPRACRLTASDLQSAATAAPSSRVLTSVDLANMTCCAAAKGPHNRCNESAPKLLLGCFARFLSDHNLAKDSAGSAGANRRPSEGKIKGAMCGPVGEWKKALGSACCDEVRFWLAACDLAQAYARSWSFAPRRQRRAMIVWSEPLPDDCKPVKARAARARLRRLAALTGCRRPALWPPSDHGFP
jgi:hypothetical protein